MRIADLWRWQGGSIAKVCSCGCTAFVLKYFLDKMVAAWCLNGLGSCELLAAAGAGCAR